VLDPKRPIREADMAPLDCDARFTPAASTDRRNTLS
jgi:hypothetical protein